MHNFNANVNRWPGNNVKFNILTQGYLFSFTIKYKDSIVFKFHHSTFSDARIFIKVGRRRRSKGILWPARIGALKTPRRVWRVPGGTAGWTGWPDQTVQGSLSLREVTKCPGFLWGNKVWKKNSILFENMRKQAKFSISIMVSSGNLIILKSLCNIKINLESWESFEWDPWQLFTLKIILGKANQEDKMYKLVFYLKVCNHNLSACLRIWSRRAATPWTRFPWRPRPGLCRPAARGRWGTAPACSPCPSPRPSTSSTTNTFKNNVKGTLYIYIFKIIC